MTSPTPAGDSQTFPTTPPAVAEAGWQAPTTCPVCGDTLATIRLGCGTCGTQIAGHFRANEFAALQPAQLDLLRVFLSSRGNLREVARHLGVSYPTARTRLTDLLAALGLHDAGSDTEDAVVMEQGSQTSQAAASAPVPDEAEVLRRVASGEMSPEDAAHLLA